MSAPDKRLEKWLKTMAADITEEGLIDHFRLFHAVDGGEGLEPLHRFKAGEFDPADMAQAVWDTAQEDADTYTSGRPQRYVVHAYREPDAEMPDSSHSFLMRGTALARSPGGNGETEPANEKGITAQHMRHVESMHRITYDMVQATAGRLTSELERETARRIAAEEHAFKMMQLQQELLDQKAERDLRIAQETRRTQRMDEVVSGIIALAPLVLAKFMAKDASAAGTVGELAQAVPLNKSVQKFLKGLSEPEAMAIFGALQPHNRAMLGELYKTFKALEEQEQEKKPEVLRDSNGN